MSFKKERKKGKEEKERERERIIKRIVLQEDRKTQMKDEDNKELKKMNLSQSTFSLLSLFFFLFLYLPFLSFSKLI